MRSWLVAHLVEIVFVGVALAAFAWAVRATSDYFYFFDDWMVLRQAGSVSRFLDPYNQSLSLVSMVVGRGLAESFGLGYTPQRVLALLVLALIPLTYFFTTRRTLTAPIGALLALPLLLAGHYASIWPAESNHMVALLGAVVAGAALNRGPRWDWVLAVALVVAICSAGAGVVVVAACAVHNLCSSAPRRRWLAVLVPALLYLIWWLVFVGESTDLGPVAMSTSQTLELVRNLAYASFQDVALGNTPVTWILIAVFGAYAVWTLSKGLRRSANLIAWSVGVVTWGFGLANNRGLLANAVTFRYRVTTLGLLLLAVVPRERVTWPERLRIGSSWRAALAAAAAVLVVASVRANVTSTAVRTQVRQLNSVGRATRAESLVVSLRPPVVRPYLKLPQYFGLRVDRAGKVVALNVGEVRGFFDRYGPRADRASADRRLAALATPSLGVVGRRMTTCAPLTDAFAFTPDTTEAKNVQVLWSPRSSFVVDVRRFGTQWVRITEIGPEQLAQIHLPSLLSTTPWQVRAIGACQALR